MKKRSNRRLVHTNLLTKLEDIPENVRCEECGGKTVREYLEHDVTGQGSVVRTRVAGWRCKECGVASFSHQGMAESFSKAREVFLDIQEDDTVKILDEAIAYERQFLS